MRSPLALIRDASHLFAPVTANCRRFHMRWAAAAGAVPPAGRWRGEWRSETSGHSGQLHCVVEPLEEGIWRASFRAGYARVFRACYTTRLRVTERNGCWTFRGESDLGVLAGGVYEYEGEATDTTFTSSYRSRYDRGVFRLGSPIADRDPPSGIPDSSPAAAHR